MPKQSCHLDDVFQALADPTRRAVLERLSRGAAPVSELAQPFAMALPSFTQHLKVLESSGLVTSQKAGRVRTYQLTPDTLQLAQSWLQTQRASWESRLNQLDRFLSELKEQQP